MARKSTTNTQNTIVLEDDSKPTPTNVAPTMYELAQRDGINRAAIIARLSVYKSREAPALILERDQYYFGRLNTSLGVNETEARRIISLKGFNRLPNAKNNDDNRNLKQDQAYGAARTDWSRLLDKALPVVRAAPAPRTPEAPQPKVANAPITISSLVVDKAAKPEDVNQHMSVLVTHMRQYQKLNAKEFRGDAGAEWLAWLMAAPHSA